MAQNGRLARFYKNFRGSKYFVIALVTFIVVWMAIHFVTGFDGDWGGLNLILSIEASVGMSVFMMVSDRQEAMQRKQLEYMLHLLEAQQILLKVIASRSGTYPE